MLIWRFIDVKDVGIGAIVGGILGIFWLLSLVSLFLLLVPLDEGTLLIKQ